ncbi:DUF5018 domain-containing protein [Parabacteroides provencensis]|uniref:DUF5018 domain-containing protein n=1 Tax=Parabacteroides provencensis TaxID=1944636 RepID=UPI000C14842E|nr:DUF5018 domain-containing protein [Parabacteroides provencensis]
MNTNKILNAFYCSLLLLLVFGCESPDMDNGVTYNKGLLNFFVKIPGGSTEYGATMVGPYNDGDTLYIKVPTTEDSPLDLTRLKPFANVENNCYVEPAITGEMDFTDPLKITVTDGEGVKRTNIIKILPTPPKTIFKKMWFKNSTEMGIVRPYISGMDAAGDNIYVHDADIWTAGDGVRVYDNITGKFKKIIPAPTTFTMQVKTDDAGHILVNRYNEYSAGFIVYYYDDENSPAKEILNYTEDAGCPGLLGRKMSVIGNLKQGKGYIYATAPGMTDFYYWEFRDGVPVNTKPTIIKYASAKEAWSFASVKRESLDENSDHYITYCIYDGNDSEKLEKGSRLEVFPPSMDIIRMNPKNNLYKIFDFDVFEVNGDKFLVTLEQGFWAWDGVVMKVFEITDKNNLTLVPDDADYAKFKLLESDVYGEVNYNQYGDVATIVNGCEVYIYASIACGAADKSGIIAYKMTYYPQ